MKLHTRFHVFYHFITKSCGGLIDPTDFLGKEG